MADSMNRSFTRKSPVKQPRGVQNQQSPRDKEIDQNSASERNAPFKQPKQSIVSEVPGGTKGNSTQREKYVKGDDVMST